MQGNDVRRVSVSIVVYVLSCFYSNGSLFEHRNKAT